MKLPQTLKTGWLLLAAIYSVFSSSAQPVIKAACGDGFTLLVKSDGSLWAMGDIEYRQLGSGIFFMTNRPVQIVASNVTAVAAGCYHSLFLKNDGSLWAMGHNDCGQLGDGTTNEASRPEQVVATNVTAIAVGRLYSLFLKSDGSLWGMGLSDSGELGNGTHGITNRPEQIVASNVVSIAAGYYHSLFIKSDGSLWGMGGNWYGPLGIGTTNNINLPEQIVASNVTAIAAGGDHSLFLKSDGSLWVMGENGEGPYSGASGALGDGKTNNVYSPEQIVANNVTAIAAGPWHSLFLKSDGSVWAMGWNIAGQVGDGGAFRRIITRPEEIISSGVTAIAAGGWNSLYFKSDNSLWGSGNNTSGQLGDGTNDMINRPELIMAGIPGR